MHEIKIPSVGESITSAAVAEWHKQDGESVNANDVVLTIETDKISTELEAGADGILHITVPEGEEVEIGAVVATVEEGAVADSTGSGQKTEPKSPVEAKAEPKAETETPAESDPESDSKVRVTPVAKRIAKEKGVDLSTIQGSGAGGKITKADVLAAADGKTEPELSVVPSPASAESSAPESEPSEKRTTRKKMSPLRRKIASHLVSAQQEAAILTTFNECDMSAVMTLRKRVQDSFVEKHGVKLGFMSLFIKAVVEALKSVPQVNARIDGDEIVTNHFYDIGVAVGTEKGLIVPVVRDCDRKTFAEIEQSIGNYAQRAREGKIQLDDIQGGVFTISNGGIYGSLLSTPILNPPQSGILGMHTIQQRPIAVDGDVVIRPMMNLALSYDHRIVDGKEAVTFLIRVKESIESPERMLVGA